jgi:hypothetical protein
MTYCMAAINAAVRSRSKGLETDVQFATNKIADHILEISWRKSYKVVRHFDRLEDRNDLSAAPAMSSVMGFLGWSCMPLRCYRNLGLALADVGNPIR